MPEAPPCPDGTLEYPRMCCLCKHARFPAPAAGSLTCLAYWSRCVKPWDECEGFESIEQDNHA